MHAKNSTKKNQTCKQIEELIMARNSWCNNHFFYLILFCVHVTCFCVLFHMPLFLFWSCICLCSVIAVLPNCVHLFCVWLLVCWFTPCSFLCLIAFKSYHAFILLGPCLLCFLLDSLMLTCSSLLGIGAWIIWTLTVIHGVTCWIVSYLI